MFLRKAAEQSHYQAPPLRQQPPSDIGPRKGFLKHFCKLFYKRKNNDEKQQNHIVLNVFSIILINIFVFLIIQFLRKINKQKSLLRKTFFS